MLRRIIPVAALLIQLAYAAIASSTPARAIDEIEMGSVGGPTALLWPLYIGTATGMFAAENLDIKQIFAPSSAGVQQQLAAGAFQISDSGLIDQVRAIFEGAPLALVRIEGQVPPYALLAQRTIKTIAELRGKTIMVGGEKDITRVYLERMLTPNGIKAGEYDLLYAGSTLARFAALQSGAVSAAILFPPLNTSEQRPRASPIWALSSITPRIFRSRGFRSIRRGRPATKNVLKNFSPPTRRPLEDTEKSYDMYRKIDFFETKGEVSKKKVAEIIDILRSDMRDKPLDINRLFLPNVTRVTE